MQRASTNNSKKEDINLLDLFYYLLSNWVWYIVAITIFVAFFGIKVLKAIDI